MSGPTKDVPAILSSKLYRCSNGHELAFKKAPYAAWFGRGIWIDLRACTICGKQLRLVKEETNEKTEVHSNEGTH